MMFFEMRTFSPRPWRVTTLFSSSAATSVVNALRPFDADVTELACFADAEGGRRTDENAQTGRGLTLRSLTAVVLMVLSNEDRREHFGPCYLVIYNVGPSGDPEEIAEGR